MMNDEFADVTFALFALKARGEPPLAAGRVTLKPCLPASPARMMNDEFADVTFALFALKARGEPPL
ncbi:hypothetical protein CKQ79_29685, partial [Klebsiella pneumoniae]